MSKYIVIPNIKIQNANAQPVWWIVSAPAITAYIGFAHALALAMNIPRHEGVAIVHHDIQFLGEQLVDKYGEMDFRPHQFKSSGFIDKNDYVAGTKSLSSQPTARCHLNVSLIIALADDAKVVPLLAERFLRGARIAGGSIGYHGEIRYDIKNHTDALKAVNKMGQSIIDRSDLMVRQEDDRDMIDTLLRCTRRYAVDTPKDSKEGKKAKPNEWIVPTCLGYAGISSLKQRDKSRDEFPHLYVEPLVGLVQYQSTLKAGLHFWRYTNPKSNIFITSTNQGIHK